MDDRTLILITKYGKICPECKGIGKVEHFSRISGITSSIQCERCLGRGFIGNCSKCGGKGRYESFGHLSGSHIVLCEKCEGTGCIPV